MIFLLSITVFAALAHGLAFNGARQTSRSEDEAALLQGHTPCPTQKAELFHDLRKRATTGQVGFSLDSNTCGYLEGSLGAPVTCRSPSSCFVLTGPGGLAGCLGSTTLGVASSCVNSNDYFASSCDNACRDDAYVLKCTTSARPYCNRYTFSQFGASYWDCDSVQETTAVDVETSFRGQVNTPVWSPLILSATSSSITIPSSTSTSTPEPLTSTVTTVPPASSSVTPSGGGGKTNVGAIVGGVVGGLAIIGGIACILIFICLRHRRQGADPQPQVAPQPQVPPQPQYPTMQSPVPQYVPPSEIPVKYEYAPPQAANPPSVSPPPPNVAQLDAISIPHAPYTDRPVYEMEQAPASVRN